MSLFNENFYTDDFDQEMIDYVRNLGSTLKRSRTDYLETKYKYLKYGSSCDYFWTNNNTVTLDEYTYLTKQQFKEKIGMTQKQFTKADLKTGMIIEFMSGEIAQVLLNTKNGDIVTGDTWFPLISYTDEDLFELTDHYQVRIKAVYLPKNNKAFSLSEAKRDNLSQYEYKVVWKREEKSAEQIEIESIQAEMDKLSQRLSELKGKV